MAADLTDDSSCDESLSSSDDEVETEEAPDYQAIREHAQRLLSMSSVRPSISKNSQDETSKDAGATEQVINPDASRAHAETTLLSVAASPVASASKEDEGPGERPKFEVKSVPQWRFVSVAKKSEGYSSKSAGEFVQGKSSEELGAKYVAPDVSLYRAEKTAISVGRLSVEPPNVAEIETKEIQVGKLKRDDDGTTEKDLELGQENNEKDEGTDAGGDAHQREAPNDSNSSATLDLEEVPIEVKSEDGGGGGPTFEEVPIEVAGLATPELDVATDPIKNSTGSNKRRRRKPIITSLLILILLVIIAVLSILLLRDNEDVESNSSNAATAGGSESGVTGIEAATPSVRPTAAFSFAPSSLPSRTNSGKPSVTFSDAPSLQSSTSPSLPGLGSSIDWTPYLVSTSKPTVAETSRPSRDETSRPSDASSPQPSTQPSNETCPEGTRPFGIQYPTSASATIGKTPTKWVFKDPCTGDVISECLPCSSGGNGGGLFGGSGLLDAVDGTFAADVSPFERNRRMQEATRPDVFQCLPEDASYVFEIALADSDECCGFDGPTAIVSYDGKELSFEAAGAFSAEGRFGQEKSCSTPRPTYPPSSSPVKPSPSSPGCPPNYKPRVTYGGGDLVINPQDNNEFAVVYSCRGFPYTEWCAQQAYEPGVALNYDLAWETLGNCELQSAQPSLSPLPFLGVCPSAFDTSATYSFGEQVTYSLGGGSYVYECDVVLCRSYGAEPSASSWTRIGACSFVPQVTTVSPSGQPSFTPTKQTKQPTRRPSQVPSSSEPSSSPRTTVRIRATNRLSPFIIRTNIVNSLLRKLNDLSQRAVPPSSLSATTTQSPSTPALP